MIKLHSLKFARPGKQNAYSEFPARHGKGSVKVKQTAGTLLYRQMMDGLEVLLVHPSGNYNRHAPWSIPKGELEKDESPEAAARRETLEETGITAGLLVPLGYVEYTKSKKQVHCFTGPLPLNVVPQATSWEIDRAEFFLMARAKRLIHPDQVPLLERLESALGYR